MNSSSVELAKARLGCGAVQTSPSTFLVSVAKLTNSQTTEKPVSNRNKNHI